MRSTTTPPGESQRVDGIVAGELRRDLKQARQRVMAGAHLDSAFSADYRDRLHRIDVPTLILIPSQSADRPRSRAGDVGGDPGRHDPEAVDDPVDAAGGRQCERPGNAMFPGLSVGGGGRI